MDHTIDADDVVGAVVDIFEASGSSKEAYVREHITGAVYRLQYQGQSARGIDRSKRQFDMDLEDWVGGSASVVGWKVRGHNEWDKES